MWHGNPWVSCNGLRRETCREPPHFSHEIWGYQATCNFYFKAIRLEMGIVIYIMNMFIQCSSMFLARSISWNIPWKNQPSSAFMHLNAMFQGIPLFWRVQTPIIGAGTQFGQAIGRFGYNLEPQAARYKHSFHQGVTRHRSMWTAQWARLDIYLHVSYNHKSKQYQKQLYHIYSIQWKLPNVHVCIYAYMQSWMKGWINGWMY